MSFPKQQNDLIFEPIEHTYIHKPTNKKLISASQLVHLFTNEFDPTGEIIENCAAKKKISVDELRKQWEKERDDACKFGTALHSDIEDYINTKKIKENPNKKYVEAFSQIKFAGQLFTETRLFNLEAGIAGTVDLIEIFSDNSAHLYDYKSNKRITRSAPWEKPMKFPLDHLMDLNYNHYVIQVSLYAYLLDCLGYWVNDLHLLHFNRKTQTLDKYDLEYRKSDVLKIIDYYAKNNKNLIKVSH